MGKRLDTSLVALLQALEGNRLIFELRNDVKVTGKLVSVDEHMNMYVDGATWQPVQGPAKSFPFLYVKGRNLRMVHLPGSLDPAAFLDQHIAQAKKQRVAAALDIVNKRHERLAKGSSVAHVETAER
eukprot:GHUV01015597.1.p1 GENE.GHUV01015597.1~~GHUV01015597.1.p1  ORF type:complete len:127 (+),score=18.48 GHUV01015597.1:92-472(+)